MRSDLQIKFHLAETYSWLQCTVTGALHRHTHTQTEREEKREGGRKGERERGREGERGAHTSLNKPAPSCNYHSLHRDANTYSVCVTVHVTDPEYVTVIVRVHVVDTDGVLVTEGLAEGVLLTVGLRVGLQVALSVEVVVSVPDVVALQVAVAVNVPVHVGLTDPLDVADSERVSVVLCVYEAEDV